MHIQGGVPLGPVQTLFIESSLVAMHEQMSAI